MLNFSNTNLYLQFRVVGYFLGISWPSPRPLCYFLFPHLLLYCFSCRLCPCFHCNFFSLIPLFLCHFFLEYSNLLSKFRFLLSFYCFLLMIFFCYFSARCAGQNFGISFFIPTGFLLISLVFIFFNGSNFIIVT